MAVPLKVIFTQGNTQDIVITGLQDIDSGTFWNSASASANLYDENGNLTMVQNITLGNTGPTGNYEGTVTTDYTLQVGGGYSLHIDAEEGGAVFHIEIPAEVAIRSS